MTEDNKKHRRVHCWNCGQLVDKQTYKDISFIPKCPFCNALYPEKPPLEAKLMLYQDTYLQSRSSHDFNKLFNPLYDMVFNIICSKLKKMGIGLQRDDIEDKVQWTLCTLASYYQTKPDFKVTSSFSSYLDQMVLFPLLNSKDKKKDELEISIYTKLDKEQSDRECTLLDKLSEDEVDASFEDTIVNKVSQEAVINNITNFLKKTFNVFYDYHSGQYEDKQPKTKQAFKQVIELCFMYKHFFNKKAERYYRELNKTCSPEIKENFQKSLELFKEYLRQGASNE